MIFILSFYMACVQTALTNTLSSRMRTLRFKRKMKSDDNGMGPSESKKKSLKETKPLQFEIKMEGAVKNEVTLAIFIKGLNIKRF